MSSRPTHIRTSTDHEILSAPPLTLKPSTSTNSQLPQSDSSIAKSQSKKSIDSTTQSKEAREEGDAGSSTIGGGSNKEEDLESFDTEVGRNQQIGVAKIEALYRAFGNDKYAVWTLYIAIAGVVCAFTLDTSTTSLYLPFATSYYGKHSLLSTIGSLGSIITACCKPLIAKISDISSRQFAYAIVLVLYVLGYILCAGTNSIVGFAVGQVLSTIGEAGSDLITDIIVADLSPLEWRGFMSSLTSAPDIWFSFVGANIAGDLNGRNQWRWGYGLLCIILPALIIPIIVVLHLGDRRAKKAGQLSFAASPYEKRMIEKNGSSQEKPSWFELFKIYCIEIDFIGLVLLAFACSLIFVPFTLAAGAKGKWGNPSIIAMWVVGLVLLLAFLAYEIRLAPKPSMPPRILYNRTFLLACTIDICYFISGFLRSTYYGSYTYIVVDSWNLTEWGYFNNLSTCVLAVFGILAGLWLRFSHRYKVLQLWGLSIRLLGMGLTFYARGDKATPANLIVTQFLVYIGGAFSVVGSRIASQASVPHQDLATVVALLALWTKLGEAMGKTIAGAVWSNEMKPNMRKYLPASVTDAQISAYFSNIKSAKNTSGEIKSGIIKAYDDTVYPLFLAATLISVIPLIAGIMMPNYYLGRTHNTVDGTKVDGTKTEASRIDHDPCLDPEAELKGEAKKKRFSCF